MAYSPPPGQQYYGPQQSYPPYPARLRTNGLAVGALLWLLIEHTRTGMRLRAGASLGRATR